MSDPTYTRRYKDGVTIPINELGDTLDDVPEPRRSEMAADPTPDRIHFQHSEIDGSWRWRLVAPNGVDFDMSYPYGSPEAMLDNLAHVHGLQISAGLTQITELQHGSWRWRLDKALNQRGIKAYREEYS